MITVVITTHAELLHHLQRCLDSVMWQLALGDECVVIADGMVDGWFMNGPGKVEYRGSVKFACTGPEGLKGVSAARNIGLQISSSSSSNWIKFLDGDDLLAPFALNVFRAVQDRIPGNVAVVAGQMIQVHNGIVRAVRDASPVEEVIERVNPTLVSMTFVRRSAAVVVDGFDERIQFEEDWDFWLRLRAAKYRFATLKTPFCYYWIDDAERAAKKRDHTVEGVDVWEFLRKKYNLPSPQTSAATAT